MYILYYHLSPVGQQVRKTTFPSVLPGLAMFLAWALAFLHCRVQLNSPFRSRQSALKRHQSIHTKPPFRKCGKWVGHLQRNGTRTA